MHEGTLLVNIAVALVAAFLGGVFARRIGLPSMFWKGALKWCAIPSCN
ncbi:MAG: hypothetical protein H6Q38_3 [Chloroflexi bacterium]|nr:hypothetical protein [Chloroflexota bacterium]